MTDFIKSREILLALFALSLLISVGCKEEKNDGMTDSISQPEITSINPMEGPVGTAVTIEGNGFSPIESENEVSFGSTPATVSTSTSTSIQTSVPEGSTNGVVNVTVNGNTASGPNFTIVEMPGIESVEPHSGLVGAEIVITGMNFSTEILENVLTFNGIQATVSSATETVLVTTVPEGATDGPIEVTIDGETATFTGFDVVTTGTLRITISTTGSDLDSDGYRLNILNDFVEIDTAVAVNDEIFLPDVEESIPRLELLEIAPNCSVAGSRNNPYGIRVNAGDDVSTGFTVECMPIIRDGALVNKIAFTSRRDGEAEIFVMNTDGSNPVQLTFNEDIDVNPVISRDGTKIAFIKLTGYSRPDELIVMNADGTNIQKVTDISRYSSDPPSWSPDGTRLLFSDRKSSSGSDHNIFSINIDGTDLKQITTNQARDVFADWSPDGSKILFMSDRGRFDDLYVMNADGSNVTQLTDESLFPSARWSPDGTQIAFASSRIDTENGSEIFVIDADGSNIQQITEGVPGPEIHVTWSGDGSEIAFTSQRTGGLEIFIRNADGTGTTVRLTSGDPQDFTNSGDAQDFFPHWSPVVE